MDITTIINNIFNYASVLLAIMAALVFITNIIVEVVKHAFPKAQTNHLVIIVAIMVTVLSMLVAASVLEITIMWYYAVGAVVLGFGVAYAAMIGFDKFLKEVFAKIYQVVEELVAFKQK